MNIYFLLSGLVRDTTDFVWTLHCLNITTYITAISWGFEKLYFINKRESNENGML